MYFNTSALARRLEREWAQAFRPFDLTPPQAFMLRVVLEKPGLLQHQLAETLDIARPTATRALDGLVAKGLVERLRTAGDGREQQILPTDEGIRLRAPINAAAGTVTTKLRELLGSQGFASTVESVRAVRAALS